MAHILIVEDHGDNRDVTALILTDAGYTVISAGDGFNGLHMAEYNQPDLIVMDLALPNLDGWETTRRLKANPATWHIPVIACTAHVLPDDRARALAAGCVSVIAKPFEIETLLTQIATVLAQYGRVRSVGSR